jgi:hypothetical protein
MEEIASGLMLYIHAIKMQRLVSALPLPVYSLSRLPDLERILKAISGITSMGQFLLQFCS